MYTPLLHCPISVREAIQKQQSMVQFLDRREIQRERELRGQSTRIMQTTKSDKNIYARKITLRESGNMIVHYLLLSNTKLKPDSSILKKNLFFPLFLLVFFIHFVGLKKLQAWVPLQTYFSKLNCTTDMPKTTWHI